MGNPDRRARSRIVPWVLVVLLAGLTHCGYNFPGEGRTLPGGATSIHIARFDNRTRDAGLENFVLEAMQAVVARRGQFVLERDRSAAQLTLEGSILSIEKRPVAFSGSDEALQYQTYVTVSAQLRDTQTGKVVWRISALREGESYGAVANTVITDSPDFVTGSTLNPTDLAQLSDVQLSEAQEREALDRVLSNLSRDLYNAMVENF
jgi:outer membrane lipopolysaccharide assembly protein LptE/RlpB